MYWVPMPVQWGLCKSMNMPGRMVTTRMINVRDSARLFLFARVPSHQKPRPVAGATVSPAVAALFSS
jgi:hypothetical protein